jgi:hypothetical protein
MKTFSFLCKQGQEELVALALTIHTGRKPELVKEEGGVRVRLSLLRGESKRQLDRMLYNEGIPGARSRKNKLRIFGWNYTPQMVLDEIGPGKPFYRIVNGHFQKRGLQEHTCPCCSGLVDEFSWNR